MAMMLQARISSSHHGQHVGNRAAGIESFRDGPGMALLFRLFLEVPRRHVESQAITSDVALGEHGLGGNLATLFADDNA